MSDPLRASNNRGRPAVYTDVSVLLTPIVAGAWRCGYEKMTNWISRDEKLADALDYPKDPNTGDPMTISSVQFWRGVKQIGLLPYLLFFTGMVFQLIRLGAIKAKDVIYDHFHSYEALDPLSLLLQMSLSHHLHHNPQHHFCRLLAVTNIHQSYSKVKPNLIPRKAKGCSHKRLLRFPVSPSAVF